MDKARLKKLFDDYNAINTVIRANRFPEALKQVNKLLDSLSDFQKEYFPAKGTLENKENNDQNSDGLLPSPSCDSKLALVVVGSLLTKLSCLTDTCTLADVKDVAQSMLRADSWISFLTETKQPVTQYVDNLTRVVSSICAKIDSKIQGTEVSALEKLIQLRTASLKILGRIVKTTPEHYFDHLYRTIVIMQKFNGTKAVEFAKGYLTSQQQAVLSCDSHIDAYLTCLYTIGRCLEKENKFAEADKEYARVGGYLDALKKNSRIDETIFEAHDACVTSHKVLLYLSELTSTKSSDERTMKLVLSNSTKLAEAIKTLLPKATDKKFAAKRTTATYDALYRINTTLREIRRIVLADISSIGATAAKVLLPEKVLDGLEKLMVVHSEVVQKGLELDTQFDSKGSLKFKTCEQYEWEAISTAALIAFERNKNESKLACEYLERASEIIRSKKRHSELKSISSLYYNIGILFYNKKNYSGAAEPMLKCCEVYEEWGKTNPIDEKTLAKRKELVSICRQKSNDVDGALKEIEDGILKTVTAAKGEVAPLVKRFCAIKLQTVASASNKRDFTGYTLMKVLDKVKVTPRQKGQALEAEFELYDKYDKEDWALDVLSGLLQVYKAKEHPVRRARMLIEQAQFDRRKQDAASALKNIEEAVELLKGNTFEDKDLQDASVNDLAIAYAWLAITRRDNDEVTAYSELDGILSSALQMWTTVVNKLSVPSDSEDKETLEENKKYFGSLEKTESTMRLLIDLFGLLDDKMKVIHTYKLLIRFYRCLYVTKESAYERILFYATIGSTYHSMGYTRSAAQYINKSKVLLDSELDLPEKYKVNWILLTVSYLHEIGQVSSIEELQKIEQSQHSIIYGKQRRTKTEYLTLAQTMSILANMQSEKGKSDSAFAEAHEALRLRSQTLPKQNLDVLKRKEEEANKRDDDPNNQIRREDEDLANTSVDEGEASSAESFFNENMTFNKWGALKAFAESLLQTAALHELQGTVYFAQYYYLKGMCLASILNAPRLKASFLLHLAKVSLKQEKWEEWNNRINEFLDAQTKHQAVLEDVDMDDGEQAVPKDIGAIEARVYLGDFKRKQAFDATGALVHYDEAENYLLELMESSVTAAIDNILLTNVAETPRVNKMLSRLKPNKDKGENNVRLSLDPLTAPKPARGKKTTSNTSSLASIEDCLPMKRMKTRVQTKKARALMMKAAETKDVSLLTEAGQILKQCLDELEQLKAASTKSTSIDKAVVLYHLGRLFMLRNDLEGAKPSSNWNQSECVVGASPYVTKGRRGQKKGAKTPASKSWTDEARSTLERALDYCTSVGSIPKLTRDICQSLALLVGNFEPCRTAFLLNYSLGITMRHEMLSLIASKLMSFRRKKLEILGDVEPDYLEESDSDNRDETGSNHSGDTVDLEDENMLDSDEEIAALTNNLEQLDLAKKKLNFTEDEENDEEEAEDVAVTADNVKIKAFKRAKQGTGSSKDEQALKESLGHLRKLHKLFSFDTNYNLSEFQAQYVDNLPSHWTVCSLAMTPDKRDLLITRIQAGKIPIVARRTYTDSAKSAVPAVDDTVKKSASSVAVKPAVAKRAALSRTKSEISKQALKTAKDESDDDSSEEPKKAPVRAGLKRSTTSIALKPKKPAAAKASSSKASEVIPEDDKPNNNNSSVAESSTNNERPIDVIKRIYDKILEENKNTTTAGSYASNRDTPEDRNKWWTERFKLDEQMKALVDNRMQGELLGYWKSLLVGTVFDTQLRARYTKLACDLRDHFGQQFEFASNTRLDLFEAFVNSFEFLSDLEVHSWVVYLTHGDSAAEDEQAIKELVEHTKSEYAAQLGEVKAAAPKKKTAKEPEQTKVPVRRNPVIFILDKSLQSLPWESMACLRSTPISRMPSLSFIRARLELAKVLENNCLKSGIDTGKTFYILNPSKDLVSTQERFEPLFKKYRWRGLAGQTPSRHDFEEALASHDLVIYCGHNAGEQYISRTHVANVGHVPNSGPVQQTLGIVRTKETLKASGSSLLRAMVDKLDSKKGAPNTNAAQPKEVVREYSELSYVNNNAVTLLMGCSSGKLVDNGDFDPDGPILSYLLAGSPAVMGCLWIVTATDTDRFTECVLTKWFDTHADLSLSDMVLVAREECKLKYLNGAAFICYGLPVFLRGHVPDYYEKL